MTTWFKPVPEKQTILDFNEATDFE